MKKVLYTKYNSLRKTVFQIKTSIIEQDGERYVVKEAMNNQALEHLGTIKKNYEKLKSVYGNIKVIPYKDVKNGLRFDFVKGEGLLDNADFLHDDLDTLTAKIKDALEIVLNYKETNVKSFEMSEEFKLFFGDLNPEGEKAYGVSNIDSIISNFVKVGNEIWCLDYEWVCDFDIPVKYVEYRILLYLYTEKASLLNDRISLEDFLEKFDFDEDSIEKYSSMEECFQQYVHGENRKYIYVNNYVKKTTTLDGLCEDNKRLNKEVHLKEQHIQNLDANIVELNKSVDLKEQHIQNLNVDIDELNKSVDLKEQHIQNLNVDIDELNKSVELKENHIQNLNEIIDNQTLFINKVKRSVKNPFYGMALLSRKAYYKFMYKFGSEKWKEKQRLGRYGYKYRHLVNVKETDYETWIKGIEDAETYDEVFEYRPKISVIIPVYNVLDMHLVPCIESVINQVYDNWELCIADDNSTWDNVKTTLQKYENSNDKIKVVYRNENGHISRATNSALEIATGEFVAFMDCDDIIRPNALYEVVKKLNENRDIDFIYSDEDKIDDDGTNRHMPHFKPDWSPDTFMSHMYTSHLGVYRKTLVDEVGGLRPGFEGAQDYDFTLRFTEKTDKIAHIPKVLYHWRVRKESTAGSVGAKPYILEATVKAKQEALKRRNLNAELELIDIIYQYRLKYEIKGKPLVSIVIPSKDNYNILKRCIESLTEITAYDNYEIILVDNGSDDKNRVSYQTLSDKYNIKYIYEKMDFNFSKMCNIGAKAAKGDYYLFLNDDIEIIEPEWLERMLGQAQIETTGAVGAKLLYPGGRKIQHTGVVNLKNGPAHAFSGYDDEYIYYCGRNRMDYNYVAVTAACLLMSAEKFKEIDGFNEELAVAYNDVDLCFKLIEHGYYNVVRNDAVLIHHESISRGNDLADENKIKRLMAEQKKLYQMHRSFDEDPFYNVNLTQNDIDFSYNYDKKEDAYSEVCERTVDVAESDKVVGNLDIVRVVKTIYIEGWAYIKGYKKNNDIKANLILYNDEHSYVVNTNKVYRPDVGINEGKEKDIDFTGFKCEFLKDKFAPGTYKIDILCKKERLKTDKSIEV